MNLFGTDGIRGIVSADLTWKTAFGLGVAAGANLSPGKALYVGKDTRASGDMLEAAFALGAMLQGRTVARLGVITTPGLSYLVKKLGAGGGVMLSASHNPAEYNGLKVFGPDGKKVSDELEKIFSQVITQAMWWNELPPLPTGRLLSGEDNILDYIDFLGQVPTVPFSGLRVAIDTAHGSTSSIAEAVWRRLGAEVHVMNNSPDGANINKNCGSTYLEALQAEVSAGSYDVGFAYDGDGDRCLAVDELGEPVDGDGILAILGIDMQGRGLLRGDTIVGTVMSNLGLERCLWDRGITLERTRVGDRFVLGAMEKRGLALGGEQSGHIIASDILCSGDGILTSLLLADVMVRSGRRLSDLARVVVRVAQGLDSVPSKNPKVLAKTPQVLAAVEEVKRQLGAHGRVLVRASGTEPIVRIMVEADDPKMVSSCITYLKEVMERQRQEDQ